MALLGRHQRDSREEELEERAPGSYLGVRLAGANYHALAYLKDYVAKQLAALLPSGFYWSVEMETPTTLPLLTLGEDFSEEQPGGPFVSEERFEVKLSGISWAKKEGFLGVLVDPQLLSCLRNKFEGTERLVTNKHFKVGYLNKELDRQEEKRLTAIINEMEGKKLKFGLSDLELLTETMGGKPLPPYMLVAVGSEYRVWLNEVDRAKTTRPDQEPGESRDQEMVRLQDQEKQAARDFLKNLKARTNETHYQSALDHLEDFGGNMEEPKKVESRLGGMFRPSQGAAATSLKHALEGAARSNMRGGETRYRERAFGPLTASTPVPREAGARRVTHQSPGEERSSALDNVRRMTETPSRGVVVPVSRRNLEEDLDPETVEEIWTTEAVRKRAAESPSSSYLWKGLTAGSVRPQLRKMADHFFAVWAVSVHQITAALTEKLGDESVGLERDEVAALVTALVSTSTGGVAQRGYLVELTRVLGLGALELEDKLKHEKDALDGIVDRENPSVEVDAEVALGESASTGQLQQNNLGRKKPLEVDLSLIPEEEQSGLEYESVDGTKGLKNNSKTPGGHGRGKPPLTPA